MSLLIGLAFSTVPTSMLKTGYMLLRFSSNLKTDAIPKQVINDLNNIDSQYPDLSIHMGVGDERDYKYTYYRPALVYMGNPYIVDFAAYMTYKISNMLESRQLAHIFEDCKIDIWLIPKGNTPFNMGNWTNRELLFDQQLRNSFLNNYDKINSSKFFDIYKCKMLSES
ncbi:MAG: hypothetical protein R2568_10160 [Candidatus Scalindua sp.]|nr:hypothetical protein [Candidatus Scalindua sp.]MDV5167093.1 hypothetical protein [Candidatus Scalindua sp.]